MIGRISVVLLLATTYLAGCGEPIEECTQPMVTTYVDADGDGFGDPVGAEETCGVPAGRVDNFGDCDDSSPDSNLEATEVCDGLDNNCNGVVDDGLDGQIWYSDNDGDGFGDPEEVSETCVMPDGYVDNMDDCDDMDPAVGIECPNWVEDFEAGAFDGNWALPGNNPWSVGGASVYEGQYAAMSGSIGSNGSTSMIVQVEAKTDAGITFWYGGSSESNYDYLRFQIDGIEQGAWSGTVAWTQGSFNLSPGLHTLTWVYDKDGSVNSGADAFAVDLIETVNATVVAQ